MQELRKFNRLALVIFHSEHRIDFLSGQLGVGVKQIKRCRIVQLNCTAAIDTQNCVRQIIHNRQHAVALQFFLGLRTQQLALINRLRRDNRIHNTRHYQRAGKVQPNLKHARQIVRRNDNARARRNKQRRQTTLHAACASVHSARQK